MKVLIYRYNSICEPDVIETFKAMGLEVLELTWEMEKKDITPSEAVRYIGDFLNDNPVDFVFSINFFPYVSEVCNVYHIKYLSWIVDAPVVELYSTSITKGYNRVFIFDRALYNEIHPLNPECVFHLPLAARISPKEELFKKKSKEEFKRFAHDIAFVGSLYTEKSGYGQLPGLSPTTQGYLDAVIRAQERIYGYYFVEEILSDELVEEFAAAMGDKFFRFPGESFLTEKRTVAQVYLSYKITAKERVDTMERLSQHFGVSLYTGSDTSGLPKVNNMGFAKTHSQMPLIFNASKINLNLTSKGIRTGLPLRIFDILSCGGFLVSNYQEEIYELFVPGEDLVVYSDLDELVELCAYYLNHEGERREIAANGFERLKNNYTYEHQIMKMFKMAFDL